MNLQNTNLDFVMVPNELYPAVCLICRISNCRPMSTCMLFNVPTLFIVVLVSRIPATTQLFCLRKHLTAPSIILPVFSVNYLSYAFYAFAAKCRGCLLIKQSFFMDDTRNYFDVGGGVTGVHGFHSSFHLTKAGLSLNLGTENLSIFCMPFRFYPLRIMPLPSVIICWHTILCRCCYVPNSYSGTCS